jgi:argininosuccinate lyase
MEESKIWSGRFDKPTEKLMEVYSSSIHFDKILFHADIAVNKAWAQALQEVGIYTTAEADEVISALEQVQKDYDEQKLTFSSADEDIHSANERWLTERLGELGARIHTGRSRNDQVATDVRLWLREEILRLENAVKTLQQTIIDLSTEHITTVLAGQTHMRQAQPISFSHYLLSFFFQLQRNRERLKQAFIRCNRMPLGSGAVAGAAFPIDRYKLARRLGFDAPSENSIDATSDRDFIIEAVQCCAFIMVHLSRLAEDWNIWSSEPFRYLEIDQAYATGSSMMPQKKNPDSLELVRGKTARVVGHLTGLFILLKGIPTAYVRDLQEDKEPLFDSLEQTRLSLLVMDGVLRSSRIFPEKMVKAIDPALYATDLADYLVKKRLPFRQAHSLVGKIIADAETAGIALNKIVLEKFQQYSRLFEADVYKLFDPVASIQKRNIYGGTGMESVKNQLAIAKDYLKN